jgi:hypothetical protein
MREREKVKGDGKNERDGRVDEVKEGGEEERERMR